MTNKACYAHSGKSEDRSDWQLLSDHLDSTAALGAARGLPIGLSQMAALAGAYHDLGKYDPAFDRVLCGMGERVDHSTAGGKLLVDRAAAGLKPMAEMLAYAILGHHAGLPDGTGGDGALDQRLKNHSYRIPQAVRDACQPDLMPALHELQKLVRPGEHFAFDASVATRMAFSCLVDADFRDTEAFYDALERRDRPRDWPELSDLLPRLRARFDLHMAGLPTTGELNRLRSRILTHIRARATLPPGLFTLTVPTGGGKTLASLGFALDHAAQHGHLRIIYAIPYTSIIDQTAALFRELFGDAVVLEHHSAIDVEKGPVEGRDKARLAMEDWAAPLVVTTNVQLFESLFAARPSRCRKLHNIAGSVIVLDEAQVLPRPFLLPTLRMIDTLARHYRCTIVLCTATQPAFDSRHLAGGLPLAGRELAPDPAELARQLRRTRIVQGGAMDDAALIAALRPHPQALVIVNSRKHALALFRQAGAAGLEGVIHLTTRQFPAHRRRILALVKERLKTGQPCRLMATSLVEAGVDLDFPVGWRAEAGLDSVVQAAGRINREGRRDWQDSPLSVFTAPENAPPPEVEQLAKAMRKTAAQFADVLAPEAIRDWFEEVYWTKGKLLDKHGLLGRLVVGTTGTNFAFRSIAERYRMVESTMVPVIIPHDDAAIDAVSRLKFGAISSGTLARELQAFTVQIPAKARDILRLSGKGSFHHPELRGEQFFVLTDPKLYHDDSGLHWEEAEYLSVEEWLL